MAAIARQQGLYLHLDGARIFNAAVAQGVSAKKLAAPADSVTFCLSKGLSAPVGSVLCGSQVFIARAHRIRKQLGGGMRQAGILAAAGLVALEHMVPRLSEDHARARRLADGLSQIPGVILDPGTPYTNMVFLSLAEGAVAAQNDKHPAEIVAERLSTLGIVVWPSGSHRFRLVTHYWIDDRAVDRVVQAFADVLQPQAVS